MGEELRNLRTLHVHGVVMEAKELPKMDVVHHADPYVILSIGKQTLKFNQLKIKIHAQKHKTSIQKKAKEPTWNEHFEFKLSDMPGNLHVEMFDWDQLTKNDEMGETFVDLNNLTAGKEYDKWYDLFVRHREKSEKNYMGTVRIKLKVEGEISPSSPYAKVPTGDDLRVATKEELGDILSHAFPSAKIKFSSNSFLIPANETVQEFLAYNLVAKKSVTSYGDYAFQVVSDARIWGSAGNKSYAFGMALIPQYTLLLVVAVADGDLNIFLFDPQTNQQAKPEAGTISYILL